MNRKSMELKTMSHCPQRLKGQRRRTEQHGAVLDKKVTENTGFRAWNSLERNPGDRERAGAESSGQREHLTCLPGSRILRTLDVVEAGRLGQ